MRTTYKGIYNKETNETEIVEMRRDYYGQIIEKNIIGKYSGKPEKRKTIDPKNFVYYWEHDIKRIYARGWYGEE